LGSGSALQAAWQEQRRWSAAANRLKRDLQRARTLVLGLTLAGAFLVSLGTSVAKLDTTTGKVVGAIGAALLALVAVLGPRSAGKANVRNWVRARSISEGLKTEVYCYLTGSGRYADAATRDEALDGQTETLLEKVSDLGPYAARVPGDGAQPPALADV